MRGAAHSTFYYTNMYLYSVSVLRWIMRRDRPIMTRDSMFVEKTLSRQSSMDLWDFASNLPCSGGSCECEGREEGKGVGCNERIVPCPAARQQRHSTADLDTHTQSHSHMIHLSMQVSQGISESMCSKPSQGRGSLLLCFALRFLQ